jgi:protein-tyrosine-phosphatase
MIDEADFIVGMTRQHVVDLTLRAPRSWKRTFTLGEVVRLGELFGPRRPGESLATWVGRVGSSRTKSGLLGLPLSDDVPDPIGKPLDAYVRSRDLLLHLCSRLGSLIAPV